MTTVGELVLTRNQLQRWMKVCAGVHRLDQGLLVVLDVDKVLDLSQFGAAAKLTNRG
jgi:chemotaxis signal transduction protein